MERIVSREQFCSGEKRGCAVGKTKRGKGTKWMVVVDGRGVPAESGQSRHAHQDERCYCAGWADLVLLRVPARRRTKHLVARWASHRLFPHAWRSVRHLAPTPLRRSSETTHAFPVRS